MSDVVVLVDAKNLLYRAHFGHQDLESKAGKPTSVIFGVPVMLLDLYKVFPDAAVIICWEGTMQYKKGVKQITKPVWRRTLAPSYKGNRKVDPAMERATEQIPALFEFLDIIGYPQVLIDQLEADDTIGVLAAKFRKQVDLVVIYSKDQDFYQCLGKKVIQLLPAKDKARVIGPEHVLEVEGVQPKQFAMYRALSGDKGDNIKPVKGLGPKTAAKMIEAGVDPRLENFKEHPKAVQKAYPELLDSWAAIREAYILSLIPKRYDYPHFPEASQIALRTTAKGLLSTLGHRVWSREHRAAQEKAFIRFCAGYDMDYLIGERKKFFRTVFED